MSSIDERVVEMQFDNDQFESGIKQSTDSLDKFKESLNFEGAEKGLDSVSDTISKFSMDGVTSAVETASNSFSALETVAASALFTITNQAVQAGEQLLSSLSIDQVTAGYDKYTQKLSNVQTIMNSTGESVETVNGYMDHLMWYSDETSYGFTDMTGALANMVATGGEVETLIPMIEGVANATAYAGQNAQSFSYVMSAVNSAYSRGYMQATDWARIEHQNAASKALQETFIETAEALGKLEEGSVTLENFKTSLNNGDTKGWLDTEVMEEAFGVFSEMTEAAYELIEAGEYDTATEAYEALEDQYGEIAVAAAEAAQQAKTFGEAIDATKDAVSSKWSDIMEAIFGNYDQATELWTNLSEELYDIFAQPLADIGEVIKEGFGGGDTLTTFSGDWENITTQIKDAGLSVGDFQGALMNVFGSDAGLMAILDDCGSIEQAFNSLDSSTRMDVISQAIDQLAGSSDSAAGSVSGLGDVVNEVIRGDFGNGEERIQALTDAGYDYEEVQNIVNQRIAEGRTGWEELTDEELENLGYTEEEIDAWRELEASLEGVGESASSGMSGFDLFWGGLGNIGTAIESIGEAISKAWSAVFDPITGGDIHSALESFYDFTESLQLSEETIEKISNAFSGLFSVLKLIGNVVSTAVISAFNFLSPIISKVGGVILDLASNIGTAVTAFTNWVSENNFIGKAFDKVTDWVTSAKDGIVSFGESLLNMPEVQGVISKVSNGFDSALGKIREAFPNTAAAIDSFIENFDGLENLNFDSIKEAFGTFKEEAVGLVEKTFPNTVSKVNDFVSKFSSGFDQLKNAKSLTEAFDIIKEKISNFKFSDITDALKSFKDEFSASVKDIVDNSEFLSSIRDKIDSFISAIESFFGIDLSFEGISNAFSGVVNTVKGVITELTGIEDFSFDGIKQAFASFGEAIKEDFQQSFPETYALIEEFKQNFEEGFENISFDDIIGIVKSFGSELLASINEFIDGNDFLSGIREKLSSLVEWVKGFFNIDFSGIGEAFSTMINSIGTAISDLLTSFGILKDDGAEDAEEALASVSEPLEGMSDTISNIGDAIGEFASFIGEKLSNINIGAVAGVVAVVLLVVEAIKSLKSIANIGKTIGTVGDTLSTFLDGTGEAISAFQKDAKADAFKKNVEAVAIGIGTLVAAVAILGSMDTGDMIQGIGGLTVIVVGVIALMYQFEHMDATKVSSATQTIKAIGTALLEISASVAIIVLAMEELNKFVQDIHPETVVALGIIIAVIIGAIAVINLTSSGSGTNGTASNFAGAAEIVAFAAAVLIIAEAVKSLTKVADDINAAVVIAIVTAMLGIIAAIAVINKTGAGSANSSTGKIIAMAVEILAFAEAVNMVVSAIKKLANLGDQLNPGVVITIVAVMAAIALAMMGINGVGKTNSTGKVVALAAEILSFSVAVKIVADAIKDLAELGDQLNPGVVVTVVALIAAIALSLMGINTFSSTGGVGKILSLSVEILALSAAIGIMAAAVAGLAQIDSGAMDGALKAILELTIAMDAMMVVSNFAGEESRILSMAVLIAAIAGSMALLAVVDPDSLSGAATAMIEMSLVFSLMSIASNAADTSSIAGLIAGIAALALIIGLLATFTDGEDLVTTAAGLLLASTVFVVLGTVFGILSGLGITIDLGSIASISAGVAMLALVLGLLSNLTDAGDLVATSMALSTMLPMVSLLAVVFGALSALNVSIDLGSVAAISVAIGAIALILGALSNLTDAGDLMATSMALNMILPVITQVVAVFGVISTLMGLTGFGGVAAGLTGLLGIIAILAAVIAALGAVSQSEFASSLVTGAFSLIGEAIGDFIGSMQTAILGKSLEGMSEMMEEFGGSMDELKQFSNDISEIDTGAFDNLDAITGAFLKLTAAEFLQGISSFVGGSGDFSSFADGISSLADAIVAYSDKMAGVDQASLAQANENVASLIDLQETLPKVGGIAQMFTGEYDWSSLYTGLAEMGQGLADFSDAVSGETFDSAAVDSAITCLGSLSEAQGSIEASGGVLQDLVGDKEWSTLGTGLKEMGQALSDFSEAIGGDNAIDAESISAAIDCLTPLAQAQGSIEASGGVLQDLVGTSDWATLGTGLAEMGGALASFSESIADLDADDITNINTAIEAITALAAAQTEIESTGGFLQSLFGSSDWSTLTDGLTDLGTALAGFSSAISSEGSFDSASVESGVEAVGKLAELNGTTLGDTSGLTWIKDNLGDLGQSLADFNGSIAGLTWPDNLGDLSSIIEAIGSASDSVSGMKKGGQLGKVLDEVGPSLADFCKKMNNVEIPDMTSVADMVESIGSASESVKGMDTSQLSTILSNTGTELVSFVSDMQGVTIPDLSELVSMMKAIAQASESVAGMKTTQLSEIVGNVKESLEGFGDITMPDNASEIAAMIESIGTACTAAEGVSTDDLSTMLTTVSTTLTSFDGITIPDIVTDLAGFVESFTSITWPSDMSDMENCFESIKKVCTDFDVTIPTADSLSGFASGLSSELSSAGEDGAKALVEGLNSSAGDMTSAGETLTSAVADGITSNESTMTDAATTLCKAVVTTFGNSEGDFTTCGKGVVSAVAGGMGDTSKISAAAMSMVNQGVSTLNSGYNSFHGAGQNCAEGFRQGILSKAKEIADAAAKVVTDAIAAANAAQDSASPSKVMMQSGEWFDQGYVNGIVKLIPLVEKAAANMVDEAVDTVASESSNLSSVLEDEMNFNPVITPVLDLSQVEAGAASMNGMFLSTPSMRVNTDQITGAFGAMSNFQNGQRNPNADLLSAIKGLDERLGSVRGNVYNVNGVTYDDGTNVADAIGQLMHAAKIERRV